MIKSKISYEKNMIIQDDYTREVFKVLSCRKLGENDYLLDIKSMTKENAQAKALNDLKGALKDVKMHDKDLFMIENIVSTLEDALK